MATRAALWLRVSTDEQDTENQRIALMAEAERLGFEVVREWDLSGVSAYRGKQNKAIGEVIREGKGHHIQAVLVWAIDRLSRQGIASMLDIFSRFEDSGVRVHSLQEAWITDHTGPMRELMISIFAWIAQQESDRHSERTKAGLAKAAQNGRFPGRPRKAKK